MPDEADVFGPSCVIVVDVVLIAASLAASLSLAWVRSNSAFLMAML